MSSTAARPDDSHARRWARAQSWLPALAGLALALRLFVTRGVPMTDLPLHEGMVSLLTHSGDAAFTRGIYVSNWGHTNQLFYLLALPLAIPLGSDMACRIVVAATLVATFVAAARLCDHVGSSRWAAMLVAPAAMGWTFFQGFAPNLLGVAVLVFVLPWLDRFAQRPTARRALGACAVVLLLHAAHEASATCASIAIAILSLGRRGGVVGWFMRALPIGFAAALSAIEMRLEKPLLTAFGRGWLDAGVQMHPIDKKLEHVGDFLMGPQGAPTESLVAALVLAAIGAFAVSRRASRKRSTRREGEPEPAREGRFVRLRFELLASALFVAYLAAPYAVNFGAFLYVRFLGPAYVIGVVILARESPATRLARVLCAAVPLSWMVVVSPGFARADAERRAVDQLLPQIEEGSSVAVFGLGPQGGARPSDPLAPGNRVLAVRGGRALHSFTEYPIAPVLVRAATRWDEAVIRVYRSPVNLRPAWDLTRFRYLLVRIVEPRRASLVERALAPDARLIAGDGAWYLFESTHTTVAIDAPDAPLPAPPPATIQERVNAVLAGSR